MSDRKTPLFVRLPRAQAAALDRLADATGRKKQHLVSEMIGERLAPITRPLSFGRVEIPVPTVYDVGTNDVLTLEEAAKLLKLPLEVVRARAEEGDLPGRRFGKEWRFARTALLDWLAQGDTHTQRGKKTTDSR
jgi:excisionase family DNA binding protein